MERTAGQERLVGPFLREYAPEGRPRPMSAVVALVLYYRNGAYSVLWPDDRPRHHGRPGMLARPYSIVEVALGKHRSSFAMELPAAGGAAFFQTEVDVTWEVVDPYLVARHRVVNVADLIEPELKGRLRDVSRRFPIVQAAQASEAIQDRMQSGGWEPLGADLGLRTVVYVRLDLSARAIDQAIEIENEEREAARMARRTRELVALIQSGDHAQVAYIMASKPDEAQTMLQLLKDERRADRREALDFILHMIDQGMIEPHQVSDQTRAVIDFVKQSSGRLLGPPLAAKPSQRPLEGRADPTGSPEEPEPWDRPPRNREEQSDLAAASPPPEPWEVDQPAAVGPERTGDGQGRWSDAFEDWGEQ